MGRKLSEEELIKESERSAKMEQFNVGEDPPPLREGLDILVSR